MVTFASLEAGRDSIAVVGLGYVGLPLAIHLSRHFKVVGYDLKQARIDELQAGRDRTLEVDAAVLQSSALQFTADPAALASLPFDHRGGADPHRRPPDSRPDPVARRVPNRRRAADAGGLRGV